jgi:hypothetical protein
MTTDPTMLHRSSLLTLEAYAKVRNQFRSEVMAHKKQRTLHLGEHVTLLFEDELTVRYQVQEMLRIEKIFDEEGIQHELDAYNPLIPDGRNLKATMLLEYDDPAARRAALGRLIDIEDRTWVQVEGCARVYAIADEDLERETPDKTSAVHFLRFELSDEMAAALQYGVSLSAGIDHPNYQVTVDPVAPALRTALVGDLR